MKKENIDEIKNDMFKQIQMFESFLFNRKIEPNDKLRQLAQNVVDMVDTLIKAGVDDFDLWVFLKYREGKMRSKNSCIRRLEPKTLLKAIDEGFTIPDNTTMVEIEVKPVLNKNYNRIVSEQSIYNIKFGLNKGEELTIDQLKRRYGLSPEENLFSVQDMQENSKILKFFKKNNKVKQVELGL